MVGNNRLAACPFAELATLPAVAPRARCVRPWGLLAAIALGAAGLHGYGFALLAGLEIVLLSEQPEFVEINLENDEIGNDPDLATNYNIERIEEVAVPGPRPPAPPGFGLAGMRGRDAPVELDGLESAR